MNKFIVLTTIFQPSEAVLKFREIAEKDGWVFVVVGDLKTPHDVYSTMSGVTYLSPFDQESLCKEYSDTLGWNTSCRRNVGFFYAWKEGAEIVALVDDDNIPYDNWGRDMLVGTKRKVRCFDTQISVFDPLSVTNYANLWHRGFPIDLVKQRATQDLGILEVDVLVQENLWDGNPDIDSIARMIYPHEVTFDVKEFFTSTAEFLPFNSQNTFLHRDIIPYYMLLPHIGRVDDIWGSYLLQKQYKKKPFIVYGPPTVYQNRNEHKLLGDFEKEVYSYLNCSSYLRGDINLPDNTVRSYEVYRNLFGEK
jgi:hypothetical protein